MIKNQSDVAAYGSKSKNLKETFKQVVKVFQKRKYKNFLDIGCGNGELIQYLSKKYPNVKYTGIDSNSNFFPKKKKNCKFLKKNFNYFSPLKKYDFITAIGVSGYSQDYLKFLKKILEFSDNRSTILVEGGVNFNGYDVKIKFRDYKKKTKWQSGFDQISIDRLKTFLNKKKLKFKFINWNFPIKIVHKRTSEKIRSRTLKDIKGKYWIYNGLNIITHGYKNNFLNSYCPLIIIEKYKINS